MPSTRFRCTLAGLLLWAAGCDPRAGEEPSGPTLIPTVGGQSGQEGSCWLEPISELGFDAEDVLRTVVGRHETTLRLNGSGRPERASFELSARGKPEVSLRCGGSAFLDVDVHMQVPAADLDVTFEAVAQAWGIGQAVMVSTTFDRAFRSGVTGRAKALAEDTLGVPRSTAEEEYYFDLWLYDGRVSGHLVGRNDGRFCGLAVWPETYCDTLRVAMPPDEALGELDSERVLAAMRGIGERALHWTDGSATNIRFEIEADSGHACAGPYFASSPEDSQDSIAVELPVRVRAITSDGALDAALTGRLTALISESNGWEGRVRLEADASDAPMRWTHLDAKRDPGHDSVHINMVEGPDVGGRNWHDPASRELSCSSPSVGATDILLEGSFGFDP